MDNWYDFSLLIYQTFQFSISRRPSLSKGMNFSLAFFRWQSICPWNNICVMLHFRNNNFILLMDKFFTKREGDQINWSVFRLLKTISVAFAAVYKSDARSLAHLICNCKPIAKKMDPPVDTAYSLISIYWTISYRFGLWLLLHYPRINQWLFVYFLIKNRKIRFGFSLYRNLPSL